MHEAVIYSRTRGDSTWPWTEHRSDRSAKRLRQYGQRLVDAGFDVRIKRAGEILFEDVAPESEQG